MKCALHFYFVRAELEWIHFMKVTIDMLQLDPFCNVLLFSYFLVLKWGWIIWMHEVTFITAPGKKTKYRKNCGTLNFVNLCKYLWVDLIELLLSCKPVSDLNEHYFNFAQWHSCYSASLPLEGVVTPLLATLAQNTPDVFSQTPKM